MFKPKRISINKRYPEVEFTQEFYIDTVPTGWVPLSVMSKVQTAFSGGDDEATVSINTLDLSDQQTAALDLVVPQLVISWNLQTKDGEPIPVPTTEATQWRHLVLPLLLPIIEQIIGGGPDEDTEGANDGTSIPSTSEQPSLLPSVPQESQEQSSQQVSSQ